MQQPYFFDDLIGLSDFCFSLNGGLLCCSAQGVLNVVSEGMLSPPDGCGLITCAVGVVVSWSVLASGGAGTTGAVTRAVVEVVVLVVCAALFLGKIILLISLISHYIP